MDKDSEEKVGCVFPTPSDTSILNSLRLEGRSGECIWDPGSRASGLGQETFGIEDSQQPWSHELFSSAVSLSITI